uniref:CASP-like protein n=1 Tax=Echinostoma caproni TaxID=27848 RepID=A0A183BD63_9TREM
LTSLNHPVAGADGSWGHVAELCSLISHYALLTLLILVSLSTIHGSDTYIACCDPVPGSVGSTCPVPSISAFRFVAFASPHRLNTLLLFTQASFGGLIVCVCVISGFVKQVVPS